MYYRLVGAGSDTLVAVPGGPAWSVRYLEEALRPLAAKHTLLLYDPRGRGRSQAAAGGGVSLAGDVQDLEALRSHFHLETMTLLGHHYGAAVALLYANAHPERVSRLIFAAPMPREVSYIWKLASRLDTAALARFQSALPRRETDPGGFCRSFWGWELSPAVEVTPKVVGALAPAICDGTPDQLRARPALARAIQLTNPGWHWGDSLAKITVPVLVVTGSRNPTLAALTEAWVTPDRDARLLRLDGSSWFPWVDQPTQWAAGLEQFVSGRWPDSALVVREAVTARPASPPPS